MAVQRALVTSEWCKAETLLSQKGSTIIKNFKGQGPAEALCCNWAKCNKDLSTARLLESDSESQNSADGIMVSNASNYFMLIILLFFRICLLCHF